jgi:membrane protein implicated in regulation of membrane protease activity
VASADIILAGIAWAVLGVSIAVIAALRGRPFWPWLVCSVAFWPLALLHLIFVKHRIRDAGPLEEDK